MAAPIDDINFDLQDNRAFIFAEDEEKDDIESKLNSETTESSFQTSDHDKKISTINNNVQDELRTIIAICIFFGVSVAIALILTIYLGPPQVIPHGVVSSRSIPCSDIGGQILKSGGSAVDSSVAVILCESIYDRSVILGCGVLTLHDQRKNSSHSLDFSCSNARGQMSKHYAIENPTLLKGLAVAHEKFGLLKWKDVIQPVVSHFHEAQITDPNSVEIIELLNELSLKGIDYFYNDYLLKANWTGISASQLDDFKSYKPTDADPQRFTFKGYFVENVLVWPSSSLFMLMSIFENMTSSGRVQWNSTDFYHYFVEATKLVEINLQNITSLQTSTDEWNKLAGYLASLISDDRVLPVGDSGMHEQLESLAVSIIGPNDDLLSIAIWHGNTSFTGENLHLYEETSTLIVHNIFKPCALRFAMTGSNYINLAQVMFNHFGKSMNMSESVAIPKLFTVGNTTFYEDDFPKDILEMLTNKGHQNIVSLRNTTSEGVSDICAIWKDKETIDAITKGITSNVFSF